MVDGFGEEPHAYYAYWDFPRAFAVRDGDRVLGLSSEFEEDLDEYGAFRVYEFGPGEPSPLDERPAGQRVATVHGHRIGTLPDRLGYRFFRTADKRRFVRLDLIREVLERAELVPVDQYGEPVSRELDYRVGDWFMVPVEGGGWVTGVVARMNGTGDVFGYFFAPRQAIRPAPGDVESFRADDAAWLGMFGDLGLVSGRWQVCGRVGGFTREGWPMPGFVNYSELDGRYWKQWYDEDTFARQSDEMMPEGWVPQGPVDWVFGVAEIEHVLGGLLPLDDAGVTPVV
jgi:hypothetical protein